MKDSISIGPRAVPLLMGQSPEPGLTPPPGDFASPLTSGSQTPTPRYAGDNSLASRLLTRSALRDIPPLSPLIADTLELGTVAVLAGYTGTMKSFIAIDWACSIATATPWHHRPATRRRVLYVAAEGTHGLHNRLSAWERARSVDIADEHLSVLPMAVHLCHRQEVAQLIDLVQEGHFGFIVIDTLAKSIAGMDENSAQDMGSAVASLYALQEASEGTVLAIHHTGKDKSTIRGSSALESGVDTVYTTEGDSESLKLSRTKRKDGRLFDVQTLMFEAVDGTQSGIAKETNAAVPDKAQELLTIFRFHFGSTGASRADLRAVADMPNTTFNRSLTVLVEQGELMKSGTDSRPFYKLREDQ